MPERAGTVRHLQDVVSRMHLRAVASPMQQAVEIRMQQEPGMEIPLEQAIFPAALGRAWCWEPLPEAQALRRDPPQAKRVRRQKAVLRTQRAVKNAASRPQGCGQNSYAVRLER